jgi:Amt family ammonium transporter
MAGTMGTSGIYLSSQPFRDFAGSTVVHTIGGVASLAGAMVLGPRLGSIFARDDKEKGGITAPHNLLIAAVGGFPIMVWLVRF